MPQTEINWESGHILKINREVFQPDTFDEAYFRGKIEPWLSAVLQSEHLALLAGSGLAKAITILAGTNAQGMARIDFKQNGSEIKTWAEKQAATMDRGHANFEDDFRTALELLQGLQVQGNVKEVDALKTEIDEKLSEFIAHILETENKYLGADSQKQLIALSYLKSFLITFSSRTATRDRLQLFTTNYDRFIEFGCDKAGILTLDRFIGKITPILRTTKLDLDYHYNPPGIRGEPRYVEGVVRYTKLHGSIDWRFTEKAIVKAPLPFGAGNPHPELPKEAKDHVVIYPNSSKGLDTSYYPYSELFRDFSSAICRPNSAIVTFGYGFGDSHINRILRDMLTIPSTHIVIISYDKAAGRIQKFVEENNKAQFTLLIGDHFGNLEKLVNHYLPKAAIDKISERERLLKERRGDDKESDEGNQHDAGEDKTDE
jgi:hypothetical protein